MTNASEYTANEDALAKFRDAWVEEVRQRKETGASHPPTSGSSARAEVAVASSPASPRASSDNASVRSHSPGVVRGQQKLRLTHTAASQHTSKSMEKALDIYRRAIINEQAGNLDEALGSYRAAFRLEPNVDKAYRKEELRLQLASLPVEDAELAARMHKLDTSTNEKSGVKTTVSHNDVAKAKSKNVPTRTLANIIAHFPMDVDFLPEDERKAVLLQQLPDEILVYILTLLDPRSIERFALTARKACLLSLDSSIWRPLALRTYVPPQIADGIIVDELASSYNFDYRRLYIEHPRLRLDGVYIAVCHYVRPGLSENSWVNISHLITYHRYLRFFPDGTVVSLLTNEEMTPQSIVPLLKPHLRMKGCLVGNWNLEGQTAIIRDLTDTSSDNVRYTFQMSLELRSRPLGRWNKLEINGYDSVHQESGESLALSLKHERPFWFSKVRSYA